MEDRIAISRIRKGDLDGLEILVTRYQLRAVRVAYLILYDRALAEDIVQTAFVKVAEKAHQFDEGRPFAPWFFRIVVNDALKAARRVSQSISLDEPSEGPVGKLATWLVDPAQGPEQLLEEKEARELILHAIKSLTPEQRAAVAMRYILDMSEAELSAKMDRPLSTIKWWLREARKRLRNLIGSQGLEDGRQE